MTLMIVLLIVLFLRPKGPDLPRAPNTLASVVSYLCGSRLLHEFADLAVVDARTRRMRLERAPRTYVLRRMVNDDGVVRWTIDYDDSGPSVVS